MNTQCSQASGLIEVDTPIQPEVESWNQVASHEVLDPRLLREPREATESQPKQPLGALLIKSKHLGVRQVMRLLEIQIDERFSVAPSVNVRTSRHSTERRI